jgi:hypothetical protein
MARFPFHMGKARQSPFKKAFLGGDTGQNASHTLGKNTARESPSRRLAIEKQLTDGLQKQPSIAEISPAPERTDRFHPSISQPKGAKVASAAVSNSANAERHFQQRLR